MTRAAVGKPQDMETHETDIRDSNPNANGPDGAAGDMGVSSERTGPTGPGQESTDGVRPTDRVSRDGDEHLPPEQASGEAEENPDGLTPKAGYSETDPRSV